MKFVINQEPKKRLPKYPYFGLCSAGILCLVINPQQYIVMASGILFNKSPLVEFKPIEGTVTFSNSFEANLSVSG